MDTPAPRAREREVGRSSPRPPRLGAVLSPAALSAALACPPASRRIKHQVARAAALGAKDPARPLPRELCNLHKAEDIHAGGRGPERGGSRALSHASDGSLGSPMAGRDLSAPRGSSGGGGSGWRRRPGRACTWRRRLLPPSGRELRVHPGAGPLMGARAGKTQWRGGGGGESGRVVRPAQCALRRRGLGEGRRSRAPGWRRLPRTAERSRGRESAGALAHTRAPLAALQLPPSLLPQAESLLLSPPPPRRGCSPVAPSVCLPI